MNQEQVIEKLLQLNNTVDDFAVTFTGKKSKKLDGLYKPEKREIIIHNKNFNNDNALIYTAIHEFAHHIHFTQSMVPISARAHTNQFWNIFHKLLFIAEEKGIFVNIFKKEKRFIELTKNIKEKFLSANGHLMKEFGKLLMDAYDLCLEYNVSFEDYVDRELQLHRSIAKTLMKFNSLNINPEIGYENMKILSIILSLYFMKFNFLFAQEIEKKYITDIINDIENYHNKTITLKLRFKNLDAIFNKIIFYDKKNMDIAFDISHFKKDSQFQRDVMNLREGMEYLVQFKVKKSIKDYQLSGDLISFSVDILLKLP